MREKRFERDNHGHRKLLALSIQDYLNQPRATLSGDGGTSLLGKLSALGVGISRGVLTRLSNLNVESRKGDEYPSQAIADATAQALATIGFWPAGDNIERCLRRIPAFYDGFNVPAEEALRDVITHAQHGPTPGTYVSYQYSSIAPDTILTGTFTFGPMTDWRYAPVTNVITKTCSTASSITYEGIAWSDGLKNIYALMRTPGYDFPFFLVLNDFPRENDGHSKIVAINGTGLGAARQHTRHLTSITLCNTPYPEDDSPIYPDQHHRLPPAAQRHLLAPLAFGHTNGRPQKIGADLAAAID
jgi:hypothetical protein